MLKFFKVLQIKNFIGNSEESQLFALKMKKNINTYNSVAIAFISFVVFIFQTIYLQSKAAYLVKYDGLKIFARFIMVLSLVIFILYILFKMKNYSDKIDVDLIKQVILLVIGLAIIVGIVWLFDKFYNYICRKDFLCLEMEKMLLLITDPDLFSRDIDIFFNKLIMFVLMVLFVFLLSKNAISKTLDLVEYLFSIKNNFVIQFLLFITMPLLSAFLVYLVFLKESGDSVDYFTLFPVNKKSYLTWLFVPLFLIYAAVVMFLIKVNNISKSQLYIYSNNELYIGTNLNKLTYTPKIRRNKKKLQIYALNI